MLTAQASGVQPGGRGASSNTPSLGNCLSFPHLTIYTWSISGLFFCNRLFRPPKEAFTLKTREIFITPIPRTLLRALSHQCWLSPQSL